MKLAGLQKLTTSDFPGFLATIVFTQGCNLRCPYCQNSSLITVLEDNNTNSYSKDDFFDYLHQRKGILEGVVISRWGTTYPQ